MNNKYNKSLPDYSVHHNVIRPREFKRKSLNTGMKKAWTLVLVIFLLMIIAPSVIISIWH